MSEQNHSLDIVKIKREFTPGPWKVGIYKNGKEEALAVWDETITEGKKGNPICKISPVAKVDERDRANARLIAAAPELIDALLQNINDGECYCVNKGEGNTAGNPCAWCVGRAIIEKATKVVEP